MKISSIRTSPMPSANHRANCGQANPFFRGGSPADSDVIIVGSSRSSPPAMQLPDRGPTQAARRAAIERHFKPTPQEQRNAGSGTLSSRQQPAIAPARTVFVQTVLHYAEVKDMSVKTYHKWELICEYYNDYGNPIDLEAYLYSSSIGTTRMHLPIDLSFNAMGDFIK
jgi:hypothetical protein